MAPGTVRASQLDWGRGAEGKITRPELSSLAETKCLQKDSCGETKITVFTDEDNSAGGLGHGHTLGRTPPGWPGEATLPALRPSGCPAAQPYGWASPCAKESPSQSSWMPCADAASLLAHTGRSLLSDGPMMYFSVGPTSAKDLQELLQALSKPLAPSRARCVQSLLCSCQRRRRRGCFGPPSTLAVLRGARSGSFGLWSSPGLAWHARCSLVLGVAGRTSAHM